jgi:hypothetical protein
MATVNHQAGDGDIQFVRIHASIEWMVLALFFVIQK